MPLLMPELARFFGNSIDRAIADNPPPHDKGWITLTLPFESLESARERLLGFGSAIEVLAPLALRWSMLDYARQIVDLYQQCSLYQVSITCRRMANSPMW